MPLATFQLGGWNPSRRHWRARVTIRWESHFHRSRRAWKFNRSTPGAFWVAWENRACWTADSVASVWAFPSGGHCTGRSLGVWGKAASLIRVSFSWNVVAACVSPWAWYRVPYLYKITRRSVNSPSARSSFHAQTPNLQQTAMANIQFQYQNQQQERDLEYDRERVRLLERQLELEERLQAIRGRTSSHY